MKEFVKDSVKTTFALNSDNYFKNEVLCIAKEIHLLVRDYMQIHH